MELRSFGFPEPDWVAVVQQLAMIEAIYRDRRDLIEAYIAPDGEMVEWDHRRQTWPPSWTYIRFGDQHFVIVEGSTNYTTQFVGHAFGVFTMEDFVGTSSANGNWLEVARDTIAPQLPDRSTGTWHYAGHSYGGAVAGLLAVDHAAVNTGPLDRVQLMVFGTPRYMTTGWDGRMPRPHYEIQSTWDVVPELPPPGLAMIGTALDDPIVWIRGNWFWTTRGDIWSLNLDGRRGYDDLNLQMFPTGWESTGIFEAHLGRNYWARLDHFQAASRPNNLAFREALDYFRPWFEGGNPAILVESLPPFARTNDGELIPVPDYDDFPEGGGMPVYQVGLHFKSVSCGKWTEIHYVEASSPEAAAAKFNAETLSFRLEFLSSLAMIEYVEATDVRAIRKGIVVTMNLRGLRATGNAENIGSALNVGVYDVQGRQRWSFLRGFGDQAVYLNRETGGTVVSQGAFDGLTLWFSRLASTPVSAGWWTRLPITEGNASSQKQYIVSLDGQTTPGLTIVTTIAPVTLGTATEVSIHVPGKPRALPGINNLHKVMAVAGSTLKIPYVIPAGGMIAPGNGSYMRPYLPSFVQYANPLKFEIGRLQGKRTAQCG